MLPGDMLRCLIFVESKSGKKQERVVKSTTSQLHECAGFLKGFIKNVWPGERDWSHVLLWTLKMKKQVIYVVCGNPPHLQINFES